MFNKLSKLLRAMEVAANQIRRCDYSLARSTLLECLAENDVFRQGYYIASKTSHAPRWIDLRANGVPFTASWIDEAGEGQSADYAELSERCLAEIGRSAAMILYCEPGELLKGALVEAGAALMAGVPVILVGRCESLSRVFRKHPLWKEMESLPEALALAGGV